MKRLSVLLMAACLFAACNNKKTNGEETRKDSSPAIPPKEHINPSVHPADTTATTGKWPDVSAREFISNCAQTARSSKVDSIHAVNYCRCMQQKLEERYPDIREAQAADMNSPEMTKMMQSCMQIKN